MRSDLKAQVADQAAEGPAVPFKLAGDHVEVALQPLAWCERLIVQRFAHQAFQVVEILVEHFHCEGFFRTKMIRK